MSGLKVPLQPRPSRFPISLEPGSWTVGCIAPELGQESTVRIQVLDPSGLWASPGVACEVAHRVDLALQPAASTLKNAVRQAVNTMTSPSSASTAAQAWLAEHTAKLPMNEEATRLLRDLVKADAALRAYKARPETAREWADCSFVGRVRFC